MLKEVHPRPKKIIRLLIILEAIRGLTLLSEANLTGSRGRAALAQLENLRN